MSPAAVTVGTDDDSTAVPCTVWQLVAYFLRLGTTGFGGPIALIGYMEKELVGARRWVSREDYLEGLALSQLAPGPLAAQLAMYIGWVRGRILGATLVGTAFVLPSFLMVLALSVFYVRFGGLPWMRDVFYGVAAAVIAIIVRSAYRLSRMTLGRDWLLWLLCAAGASVTAVTGLEIIWLFLASGLAVMLIRARPQRLRRPTLTAIGPWLVTGLHGAAGGGTLWTIFWYFTQAGTFVFGSGLAVVPFLHAGVVERFGWLTERQFLDAVAVAMITPGPVVITVAFIGYLAAGPVGAALAALGVFLPCYLMVVVLAPWFRRIAGNRSIKAFVAGITSSIIGAIVGAAFLLGKGALVDTTTALIFFAALLATLILKDKLPEPLVVLIAGAAGLAIRRL